MTQPDTSIVGVKLKPCPFCGGEAIKHGLACAEIFVIKHCDKINAGTVLTAIKEAQAAIASAPMRESSGYFQNGNWHPIETAPKDGGWVLGYSRGRHVYVIKNEGGRWFDTRHWSWGSDGFTHWMPLPKPPEEQGRRGFG